jgi:23S rRNA pseudoU1915 N3-methylase RlmH
MKISIWSVGKNHEAYIKDGVAEFTKRISHYYPIDWQIITPSKANQPIAIKKEEAQKHEALCQQFADSLSRHSYSQKESPYDKHFRMDYTGTQYMVLEIPIFKKAPIEQKKLLKDFIF